jgi:hypothetical protein
MYSGLCRGGSLDGMRRSIPHSKEFVEAGEIYRWWPDEKEWQFEKKREPLFSTPTPQEKGQAMTSPNEIERPDFEVKENRIHLTGNSLLGRVKTAGILGMVSVPAVKLEHYAEECFIAERQIKERDARISALEAELEDAAGQINGLLDLFIMRRDYKAGSKVRPFPEEIQRQIEVMLNEMIEARRTALKEPSHD